MSKKYNFCKDSQRDFAKVFSSGIWRREAWEVWADFVQMSACAISNSFEMIKERHDIREKLYLDTIQKYSEAEQKLFPKLLLLLVEALEKNPEQDFLGEVFMGLGLGNHWKGQFFTPYNICKMMAQLTTVGIEKEIGEKGWVSVNDPACGAGATLIAVRNELSIKGLGMESALFVAQDIDWTAALMCYLQLSLLGCPGYVIIGDSLTHPVSGPGESPLLLSLMPKQNVWVMPGLYMGPWPTRILIERMKFEI